MAVDPQTVAAGAFRNARGGAVPSASPVVPAPVQRPAAPAVVDLSTVMQFVTLAGVAGFALGVLFMMSQRDREHDGVKARLADINQRVDRLVADLDALSPVPNMPGVGRA